MKIRLLAIVAGMACTLLAPPVGAIDLVGVYQQALQNDPTFKEALATQMQAAEAAPQAWSALLPQLAFAGNGGFSKATTSSNIPGTSLGSVRDRFVGYTLDLKQSIFNFANWKALSAAKYSVKASEATYNAAALDLMRRTATVYFGVLQAQDNLKYTQEKKAADYQEYIRAKERLKVGLATITDVYNAKAAYDGSVADYISDKNALSNAKEDLKAITNASYDHLAPLQASVVFKSPEPSDITRWVDIAIAQNWQLKADRLSTLAAHQNVKNARGGHLPTLTLDAKYENNYGRYTQLGNKRVEGPTGELDVALPLYSGGAVRSKVRERMAAYALAQNTEEAQNRATVVNTRKAFLAIITSISQVNAGKQSVISYHSALEGTKAAYNVGTRTMVDVLDAQQKLYQAQKDYAASRYNYIANSILLKEQAATLSPDDIQSINSWLVRVQPMPKPRKTNIKKQNTTISNGVYLQVGAYRNFQSAKMILSATKHLTTVPSNIYPGKLRNKTLYHVQIGPIPDPKTTQQISTNLQSAGFTKPIVVMKH